MVVCLGEWHFTLLQYSSVTDQPLDSWQDPLASRLSVVLAQIDDRGQMQRFLSDVMTEKEITEISARLEAARLLSGGARYTDVIDATSLSSRTVARVSDWLANGCGGYTTAIEILSNEVEQ